MTADLLSADMLALLRLLAAAAVGVIPAGRAR